MKDEKKIDGRSVRQKTIYDDSQLRLIDSAIKLLQDPAVDQKKNKCFNDCKKCWHICSNCLQSFPK